MLVVWWDYKVSAYTYCCTDTSRIRWKDNSLFQSLSSHCPYINSEPPAALPDTLIQLPTYFKVSLGPNKSENCQVKHSQLPAYKYQFLFWKNNQRDPLCFTLVRLQLHYEQEQECQQQKYKMTINKTLEVPRLSREATCITRTSFT